MKAFCLSLGIFLLLTLFVVLSTVRTEEALTELLRAADAFPDFPGTDAAMALLEEKHLPFLRLVLGQRTTDAIRSAREEMTARYHAGDISGFMTAAAHLHSFLQNLLDTEKQPFRHIL